MSIFQWSSADDWNRFDLGESGARPGVWRGKEALYFEQNDLAAPVLLRDDLNLDCFRLQAEIAVPGPYGFVGLAFGARDSQNFELVYLSPGMDGDPGEIQYDPIMNGSSTWQIYNGPAYQAPAPMPPGEWVKLTLDVLSDRVAICVGDGTIPQLVIPNLQLGRAAGRIGVWGYLPCYVRNFSVEEIRPVPVDRKPADLQKLAEDTFVTEWMVSKPYSHDEPPQFADHWTKATVEENGTLNLNRRYSAAKKGTSVRAKCAFLLPEEKETTVTFGFSDRLRLWINEEEVYQGEWRWDPPGSDGRIRDDHAAVPVRWKAGLNTIRAEITSDETMFGWGLSMRTGLPKLSFLADEQ